MRIPRSLQVRELEHGLGDPVEKGDVVEAFLHCTQRDGTLLTSNHGHGPEFFRVGDHQMISNVELGVIDMMPGGLREIKVPATHAYQERQIFPHLDEGADIYYEIALVAVHRDFPEEASAESERHLSEETWALRDELAALEPPEQLTPDHPYMRLCERISIQARREFLDSRGS